MRKLLGVVVLCVLNGCRCGSEATPDAGADAGFDAGMADAAVAYDEFDAWREQRLVLRASPDAVPARAEALVAAKDVQGLFSLVRDDLALLPTTNEGFVGANDRIRWGPRATLRGQAGTPRERAELLKSLYVRAGFQAEVVVGTPVAGSTVTGLLAHGAQRTARYPAGDETFARWTQALPPQSRGREFEPVDPDGGLRAEVLAAVRPLLPAPPTPAAFDPMLTEVPLVRVVVDGGTVFANPNLDGLAFGASGTLDAPDVAPDVLGERTVRVVLSAARSTRPGDVFELAEHTWKASDVAGRTITAAFTTALTRAQAARARVGDANAFIPVMMVRGDGLDDAATEALSVIGTPVLRDGTRVELSDGGLRIDGELLAPSPTSDSLLRSVASLTVSANPSAYPDVELLVSARTAGGTQVPNLGADAFELREGGAAVVASLRRTRSAPPRVVLLFDRSTSIPTEFVAGAPAVGHDVAAAVFTRFPGAQVQVAAVDINGPTSSGVMVGSLTEVDAQLAALTGTGSEVWTALDAFAESQASCVVVITDAVLDDSLTPEIGARLVQGPPVLVAAVGTPDTATATRIADTTHGQALTGVTATNLAASVVAFLDARQLSDYRLVYRAPDTGPAARQVALTLRAPGTATGATTWTPPTSPIAPSALSALYLTVETDGHAVTRLLAGGPQGTAAQREEVEGALFGRFVLAVEAGAPSLSTLLDEHLAERLELEQGIDALRLGTQALLADAEKRTYFRVPPTLHFATATLPGESAPNDFTFVDGLTVTLHATLPRLGTKMVRRFDLLPLVPRETVSLSGADVFALTTERTASLAAFEAGFPKNTSRALQGKTLALFDALSVEALGPQWAGAAYPTYNDYHVIAPADGSVVAFWAVHKRTGELIGVMPEGGVGEGESTEALVSRLLTILDGASRAGAATGNNGIKVWADLEATKVTLLGDVIMLFEGEAGPDRIPHDLCNAGLEGLGGRIPGWNEMNMLPNDLNSIYRLGHVIGGHPVPEVPTFSSIVCNRLLGTP